MHCGDHLHGCDEDIHEPDGLDAALAPAEPAGFPRLERFLDAIHTCRQKKAV